MKGLYTYEFYRTIYLSSTIKFSLVLGEAIGEFGGPVLDGSVEAMATSIKKSLALENRPDKLRDRARDFSVSVVAREHIHTLRLN